MSPIFTPDFSTVDASIPIYEKGRYQIKVTKVTPFIRERKDEETGTVKVSAGVRYNLEMQGQYDLKGKLITKDLAGKTVSPYPVWLHTEGGWGFAKPFLMAAGGFSRREENEANTQLFQANDWSFIGDPGTEAENIERGSGFDIPVGRVLDVNLSKAVTVSQSTGETYENQEYGGWTPIKD